MLSNATRTIIRLREEVAHATRARWTAEARASCLRAEIVALRAEVAALVVEIAAAAVKRVEEHTP